MAFGCELKRAGAITRKVGFVVVGEPVSAAWHGLCLDAAVDEEGVDVCARAGDGPASKEWEREP